MTDYLKPSFSVGMPGTQQYRDNWDAIFGKKCGAVYEGATCELKSGHTGPCKCDDAEWDDSK